MRERIGSVTTFDPTGTVFTCPRTHYTVLRGTVRFVSHDSTAADGSEHVTIKRVPIHSMPHRRRTPRAR